MKLTVREDMKSAQQELSAAAGANAARSIIGRVSGIAPSAEALAQAEPQAAPVSKILCLVILALVHFLAWVISLLKLLTLQNRRADGHGCSHG